MYETAASRLKFEPPPTDAGEGTDAEYTYLRLALSPYGRLRQDLLVRSFLLPKMEGCKPVKRPRKKPVVYRVAAFVIRKTDLSYRDQGEERHEAATLDDDEVAAYKRAWRFAMDAVRAYAKGRFEVETTWFELDGATLRGVTQRSWKGLVQQRHLDPKKIEPRPDKLFKRATRHNDCVIFVWPRGKAAAAFGGGRIRLPCRNADLAVRGGVLSISTDPRICLHEFLHTIEENVGPLRAHGPKGRDLELFATQDIHDEVEWYAYRSVGQLSEPAQPEGPPLGAPAVQMPSPSSST